jgi:ribonuclease P protein component
VLAAAYRLRRTDEFAAAIRGGRRASRGSVVVHLLVSSLSEIDRTSPAAPEGTERNPFQRAGFVVSKAVGGAVARNAVKRRLRHLMATRLDRLPAGASVVVRALAGAADVSYAQLGADLDAALAAATAPRARPRAAGTAR